MFVDGVKAKDQLQRAADAFRAVLDGRVTGLLAERATFGLARANESLGNLDDARRGYEAVAADFPNGVVAGMARQRARALAGEPAKEWYGWFENQKLSPPPAPPVDDSPILGIPTGEPAAATSPPAGNDDGAPAGPSVEAPPATSPAQE